MKRFKVCAVGEKGVAIINAVENDDNGPLTWYSDAIEEIEKRDKQIDLLKSELELSKQEIYSKDQIIAQLNPCGHTGFESVSCDVCGYPDSRKLIAKLKAKVAGLSDSVGEYSLEEKDLRKKLSHLTAMIESDEVAEKVADKWDCPVLALSIMETYRVMLLEEIGLISAVITKEDMEHYTEDIGI
jgi:hypothetical protein